MTYWKLRFYIAYIFTKIAVAVYPIKRIPIDFPLKCPKIPSKIPDVSHDLKENQPIKIKDDPFYNGKVIVDDRNHLFIRSSNNIMPGIH